MTPGLYDNLTPHDRPSVWARLAILVAIAISTVRLVEGEPLQSANDRSRWTTVWSLVERGTYRIDEIIQIPGWDTIDKVRHEDHFYSSKPPLLSTMVAGLYWLVKHTLGWTIDPRSFVTTTSTTQLILWFVNLLPTWIALECLARIVWRNSQSRSTHSFILLAGCFGTLWSAYLPSLNNHTPALCCVMIALAIVDGDLLIPPSRRRLAGAGFLAGLAMVMELPAAAFLAGLAILQARKGGLRVIGYLGGAALIPIAAHFITNYLATGSWKPFYASYGTEKYRYIFEGIPSYWLDPRGVDKAGDSFPVYLLHCLVGHHGLFSLTPILILSVVGAAMVGRWRGSPLAGIHMLGIGLTLLVFGFYMSRPANFNYGGVSVGLRWMIWLIPFWLLMMIPVCDTLHYFRPSRWGSAVLLAASVFSAWHPFDAPWKQPWLFNWMQSRGWINYRDPAPTFDRPMRSWISKLPDGADRIDDYWVELSTTEIDGAAQTLRISDGGPVTVNDLEGRRIDFVWNAGRKSEDRRFVVVDRKRFEAGDDIAACLLWPEGVPPAAEVNAATELLRGVPSNLEYRCANVRYLRLPFRRDAFRCRIGVAWANRLATAPGISGVRIRSEFWSTPEIPFGIAIWDIQTNDARTGAPLARRRMSVSQVGRIEVPPPEAP